MAQSPSHRFGQVIGNMLESVVEPFLARFAQEKGLYLDHQSRPRAARKTKKVIWEDLYGNAHDLDFVIEKNGSRESIGIPVAFIEVAWRRYTKHSRNKVQEIQGAILPVAERYRSSKPLLGAVLAGVFTEGSLDQLRSLGFSVLHFPYETLVKAYAFGGIDIRFDEKTPDEVFLNCIRVIQSADAKSIQRIKRRLVSQNRERLNEFMASLSSRLGRIVEKVIIMPMYGHQKQFATVDEALKFLDEHCIYEGCGDFRKYEVIVRFSNGDRVEASLKEKASVRDFLVFATSH